MKKLLLLLPLLFSLLSAPKAQQVHFSQFYNAPLLLNPALAGHNECIMRAGGGYRDQWRSVSKPYKTYDFFVDARVQPYQSKHNWLGVGLQFYGDKAGTSRLGTSDVRLAIAMHQGLIKKNELVFSLGLSVAFVSRTIDFSDLYFGSQWNGSGFDPSLPSNEPSTVVSASYLDLNAGLLLTYFAKYALNFHAGVSIDHLTMPRFSFNGSENLLGWRILVHAGSNVVINRKTNISPKAYYSMQDGTYEIVFGTNMSYRPRYDPVFFGLWYRWDRDIIPMIGYGIRGFNFMFTYDLNISRFRIASKLMGGFEITLVKAFLCDPKYFKKKDTKYRKPNGLNTCPIF